jgi:glucan biosynthesis protein C
MGGRLTSSIVYRDDGRMYFFDHLRTFIILLVIVFHVAIGYMAKAPQWWYVVDTQKSGIFDLFVMNADVFIMPAMFFIAGYFALPVLHKKGIGIFMREKFFRIVVPWVVGVLVFAPALTYMIWYSRTDSPPEYADYLVKHFFTAAIFNHAHYWFLGVLAWFFLLLACFYRFRPAAFQRHSTASTPSFRFFILFAILTALGFFVPNLFFHADAWFSKWVLISFQPTRLLLCGA